MKTINSKISGLLYLLLWITPLLFSVSISVQKEKIHQRMEEELKSKDLQTIILQESEVVWMDKHEIWINNSMFDILTKKLENGIYTFTGLYDTDETELVKEQQTNTEKDQQENQLLTELFECLHNIFHNQEQDFYSNSHQQAESFCLQSSALLTQSLEILTPPPQV